MTDDAAVSMMMNLPIQSIQAHHAVVRPSENATVVMLTDVGALRECEQQLDALATRALEPNIFYEPWMLFPALNAYAARKQLIFALVYLSIPDTGGRRDVLCGFFPLEKNGYRGLPIPGLTLWRYPYCFLATPLVDRNYVAAVYRTFFNWVNARQGMGLLLELPHLSVAGLPDEVLHDCTDGEKIIFSESRFVRSLFRPGEDADHYLSAALSSKALGEFRRQYRRMGELGRLECDQLQDDDALERWTDEFLQLEAAGWKGRSGTAFKSNRVDQEFFRILLRNAFERKRLMLLALRLDGRPVAMKCNFLAGDGGFAFKIAFDENYHRYSPGVLLEIENIRKLHANPSLRWMDSCAAPDHFMINRLWTDRKSMRTLLLSSKPTLGGLLVRCMDKLKCIRSRWAVRQAGLKST